MEFMPSACDAQSSLPYRKSHNPFVYFSDVLGNGCATNVLPYPGSTGLLSALSGATAPAPDFVWITPNINDDMHTGTVAQGDTWLQNNVGPVLTSTWFTNFDSTVIIAMDENVAQSTPGGGQVPLVIVSSDGAAVTGTLTAPGNHYGTLRAIEETFGLVLLGGANDPSNGDPISSF